MIVIKIMGGFASQVYKFLLGAKLADYLQTELILDVSDYYDGYFRPYHLNLLNLPVFQTVCTREIDKKYPRLIRVRDAADMESMVYGRQKGDYYIFREEPDYADFFWKHPEFEVNASTPYIKTLALKEQSLFIEAFKKNLSNQISVAVHVRRGDFVTLGQESKPAYFRSAIAWFYERNPETEFYFFSNDISWVKEEFGSGLRFHYVHAQSEKTGDIEELFCMSYCNCRILSSYSGYGLLANTLAAVRDENGFALIEEKEDGAYEYKGIEGSIKYLSQKQIKKYDLKFNDIYREACEGEVKARQGSETDTCKTGVWKETETKEKKFFVVTCENYSKWFRRGMFEIAVRLAEKGYEVSYINLHSCLGQERIKTEAACNMDGVEYGFDIVSGNLEQIEQLVQKNRDAEIVCDCKVPFPYSGQSILMKSQKAGIWQKKWTMALLKSNLKAGIRYVLLRNCRNHYIITLLDQYWKDILMRDSKSDEEISEIYDQVYRRVVAIIDQRDHRREKQFTK